MLRVWEKITMPSEGKWAGICEASGRRMDFLLLFPCDFFLPVLQKNRRLKMAVSSGSSRDGL